MREWFAQEAIASPGPGLPSAHPSELLWCGLLICIFIEQIHHLLQAAFSDIQMSSDIALQISFCFS